MKLKVCGMKYAENISQVVALQPDYIGFIFHENSSRYFDDLIPEILQPIKKVGVFVNSKTDTILEKARKHNLDMVQLHGSESPEFCLSLKQDLDHIEIIKVFSVRDDFDFSLLKAYEPHVAYFLFDTKGKLPGGNGYTFNWKLLKNYPSHKPYFLSGGIGLETLEDLKVFLNQPEAKHCYAIDVNSKFEIKPALKDFKKLKEFKSQL